MSEEPILKLEHIHWCRNLFRSLDNGGVWGIPRSGLLFARQGDALALVATMPHMPEMADPDSEHPITPDELLQVQQNEFEQNRLHFEAAGIKVLDQVGITRCK